MKRRIYQIDAFTNKKFLGNPAGVVTNAEGMTGQQMQALSRELNNSETAFISESTGPDHDVLIRYFTPTAEVPVCGHATIASGYAIWLEGSRQQNPLRIKTGAGIMTIELDGGSDFPRIKMTQGRVEIASPYNEATRLRIIDALGLDEESMDQRCPVGPASTGHSKVMIAITSKSRLDSLSPDLEKLKSISREINCNGYYVFTFESEESNVLVSGRMFAPAIGIAEDPVTGNANGPLGAYLVKNKIVTPSKGKFSFVGKQGEAIGRKGYVTVHVDTDEHDEPCKVVISGEAVEVFRTEVEI